MSNAVSALADKERQLAVAEKFADLWADKYPFWVSTSGSAPGPVKVETVLEMTVCRIPVPACGFALWGFRTERDMRVFIRSLPGMLR